MSKTTIEWSQRVWNFLTGCTKISAGCKFCYMFVLAARLKGMGNPMYRNGDKLTVHEEKLMVPSKRKIPTAYFVNSMSDFGHPDVPIQIIISAVEIMNANPHHIFQILTKRPERLLELQEHITFGPNIWIGVSVEDERVLHRIDTLRKINVKIRWISAEPLIGPLTNLNLEGISWVVAGGESGNRKDLRPVKEEWIIDIKDKCKEKEIPFFFKQWGKARFNPNPDDPTIDKIHPQHAKGGCQLLGNVYREFPESFNNILNQNKLKTKRIMKTKSTEAKNKSEIILNGNVVPQSITSALIPLVELLLDKKTVSTTTLPVQTEGVAIEKLSPFKLLIAKAIIAGEDPASLALRMANERSMPLRTAKAYVTMVERLIKK